MNIDIVDKSTNVKPVSPVIQPYFNSHTNKERKDNRKKKDDSPYKDKKTFQDYFEHSLKNDVPNSLYNSKGKIYAEYDDVFLKHLTDEVNSLFGIEHEADISHAKKKQLMLREIKKLNPSFSYMNIPLDNADYMNVEGQEYQPMNVYINDERYHNNKPTFFTNNRIVNRIMNDFPVKKDVSTVLLTSPAYGATDSYTHYVNGDPRNEMYRHVVLNEPREIIHNTNDFSKKYFEDDNFTLKSGKY